MKKLFSALLALALVLVLAACGGSNGDAQSGGESGVDISAYPADINAWTGQNFIDYFTEAGVFGTADGGESWLQDHADYWPGTPVADCAGWWDDMNNMIVITILSPDLADSSQEQYDEWMTAIRDTKAFPGDYAALGADHLVGNVVFKATVMDDDIYERMNGAYQNLVDALGLSPEF